MSFASAVAAAQAQVESVTGEAFLYSNSAFVGVFSDDSAAWTFDDFCQREQVDLICSTSKAQWATAGKTPENRGVVTYLGEIYTIEAIRGARSGDPCYTLAMRKRT